MECWINHCFEDHLYTHHQGTDYSKICLVHDIPVCYRWWWDLHCSVLLSCSLTCWLWVTRPSSVWSHHLCYSYTCLGVFQLLPLPGGPCLNKNNFNNDRGFMLCQAWSHIINMLLNVKAWPEQSRYLTLPTNPLVSLPAMLGRYIIKQTDFGGDQLPDDKDRDGPWNGGLFIIQPPDSAASLRTFYWIWSPWNL